MDKNVSTYYNGQYNKYIGARYVPIFDGEWDNTKSYEPLVIVSYQGNSYTSKTFVPIGADINNEIYWVLTGNYNAQVEAYRKEVQILKESLENMGYVLNVNDGDDITEPLQDAFNIVPSGTTIILPKGNYIQSGYTSLLNKDNISIVFNGNVSPSTDLSDVNFGLIYAQNCNNLNITVRYVNISYAYSCNVIRLKDCSKVLITSSFIDIKYNTLNGTACVLIDSNCNNISLLKNSIRSGYGVLVNSNSENVKNITIIDNTFIGQKEFGSSGQGDAIEFNCPTYSASDIKIKDNTFHGYEVKTLSRLILIGFANCNGIIIEGNYAYDNQCEFTHFENGCNNITVCDNVVNGCIHGVNIQPTNDINIDNVIISDNVIKPNKMSTIFDVDYGSAILINVNIGGTGVTKNVNIINNICDGENIASRGICIYDTNNCNVTNNSVVNFPRAGFDIRKFGNQGNGIDGASIQNNYSSNNGWNYIIGGINSGGSLSNVIFDKNVGGNSKFNINFNSEISEKINCQIRLPYETQYVKYSVGDILYQKEPTNKKVNEMIVTVAGNAGIYKAIPLLTSDIHNVKRYSLSQLTSNLTFAIIRQPNQAYAIPSIVTIEGTAVKADGTEFQYIKSSYITRTTTAINQAIKVGTDVVVGASTITESHSGLIQTFSMNFPETYCCVGNICITERNALENTMFTENGESNDQNPPILPDPEPTPPPVEPTPPTPDPEPTPPPVEPTPPTPDPEPTPPPVEPTPPTPDPDVPNWIPPNQNTQGLPERNGHFVGDGCYVWYGEHYRSYDGGITADPLADLQWRSEQYAPGHHYKDDGCTNNDHYNKNGEDNAKLQHHHGDGCPIGGKFGKHYPKMLANNYNNMNPVLRPNTDEGKYIPDPNDINYYIFEPKVYSTDPMERKHLGCYDLDSYPKWKIDPWKGGAISPW